MSDFEQPSRTLAFGTVQHDQDVVILANAKTDLFVHPTGAERFDNVPRYCVVTADPVFSISAKVSVGFMSAYDAGALYIDAGGDQWGKIAFEFSPQRIPTIVSVVTKGTSDDCDGPRLPAEHAYLRLYRDGRAFALHFSEDGRTWRFLRWFSLNLDENASVEIGLSSQSPTGDGCTAIFSEISVKRDRIDNLRDGS